MIKREFTALIIDDFKTHWIGENDFFEKEDNNFVIYRKLFAKI